MRSRRSFMLLTLGCCTLLLAADKAEEPKVELRVANYDDLGNTIKDLKGKIVIVDFWADT